MDVGQVAANSDMMFQIIKQQQQIKNETANDLIKMALTEKTATAKSHTVGQVMDVTA